MPKAAPVAEVVAVETDQAMAVLVALVLAAVTGVVLVPPFVRTLERRAARQERARLQAERARRAQREAEQAARERALP